MLYRKSKGLNTRMRRGFSGFEYQGGTNLSTVDALLQPNIRGSTNYSQARRSIWTRRFRLSLGRGGWGVAVHDMIQQFLLIREVDED